MVSLLTPPRRPCRAGRGKGARSAGERPCPCGGWGECGSASPFPLFTSARLCWSSTCVGSCDPLRSAPNPSASASRLVPGSALLLPAALAAVVPRGQAAAGLPVRSGLRVQLPGLWGAACPGPGGLRAERGAERSVAPRVVRHLRGLTCYAVLMSDRCTAQNRTSCTGRDLAEAAARWAGRGSSHTRTSWRECRPSQVRASQGVRCPSRIAWKSRLMW